MQKRPTTDQPLPKRYREFLEDGELERLQEAAVMRETYNGPLPVRFQRENLEAFTLDDTGLLPLATLGDDDPRLLLVDPQQPELPVVARNELTGEFDTVEGSLDDFLKSLRTDTGKAKSDARKKAPKR